MAHFDETFSRIDGRLSCIHSASTDTLTLLTAHRKRYIYAMNYSGVLPAFSVVSVHDSLAPYLSFEEAVHALCGSHHLRELHCA